MFDHWLEVRKGPLLNIGQQLRLGRFPGFDEGAFALLRVLHASCF